MYYFQIHIVGFAAKKSTSKGTKVPSAVQQGNQRSGSQCTSVVNWGEEKRLPRGEAQTDACEEARVNLDCFGARMPTCVEWSEEGTGGAERLYLRGLQTVVR